MVRVFINGDPLDLDDACTVVDLLRLKKLDAAPCAVEVNAELVPKRQHEQHELHDGDRVEIVTLVGGG